jgi:hypothetical protein
MAGRPSDYTDELANEICKAIATSSKGLKNLCAENPHWPHRDTILEWRFKNKAFSDLYMQAKVNQVEALVDECLDIADDTDNDTITKTTKSGEEYEACNSEWLNRSRLRIDTRKWLAAKLAPKLYGERQKSEHDISEGSLMEKLINKL